MKKTIITFGLISGVISSALMIGTIPFYDQHRVRQGLNPWLHVHRAVIPIGVFRHPLVSR